MKHNRPGKILHSTVGNRVALPLVYTIMILLVVGMAFYFSQLMEHARTQAINHLSTQAKTMADEIEQEISRLEEITDTLATLYFQTSLIRDEPTARTQILENLKLHMVGGHFNIAMARVRTPDGHLTTLKYEDAGEFHLESEMVAPAVRDTEAFSWWEVDQGKSTYFHRLKGTGKYCGVLELVFSTQEIMAGFEHFDPLSENGRLWWIDQNGTPSTNAFPSADDLPPLLLNSLVTMMDQLQTGVIETECPWHHDHQAFTALAPVFLGDYDLAVMSSMDASKITGPQIRLALILSTLFGCLLILALFVLKLNISQRKTALQKLADEKAVIEGMFHSIDDLIFQQDLSGVYTDCNQSFANFFGLTPQQIRGHRGVDLGIPPDQNPITDDDRQDLKRARSLTSEVWMKRQDGQDELVDLHKHPLQPQDGEVYGVIGIGRVKTGQWRSEQNMLALKDELEEANENMEDALNRAKQFSTEAENANRAKSEFLANMSHEIRTPLGAVIGLTDLLAQTDCTGQQLGYLNKLDNSAHSLLGIINDILDFSKIEAGKMTFEITPFHLGDVISQVTEMFSERVMSRHLFFVNKRDQVPELLLGDPVRLRQILVNLLGNSLKFTEKGGITLTVTGGTRMGSKVFLVFSVQDTGVGIPAEKLGDLFSSFSQADTSTTRKFGGTGLGLSISQQLVELMGGNIWVESTVGTGTTFHFSLPFEEMAEEDADAFMEEMFSREQMIATKPGMPLEGLNLLLVDDNEINREVISEILIQRGAKVALAENGSEGVDKVSAQNFHLVLMDMQMPVMDGPTATKTIRRNISAEDLPILALTANAQAEDKRLCLAAGMNDYMAKPVDPAALVDKVLAMAKNQPRLETPEIKPLPESVDWDPRIPGIILPKVMKRLGNKKELFIKLLGMFVSQHSNDLVLLDQALADGDRKQAIHLAHALKGTAGNLSAVTVQSTASDLETDLRSDSSLPEKTPDVLRQAMEEVLLTMEKLLGVAAQNETKPASSDVPVDREQVVQTLKKLKGLIEENDATAEDQFSNCRANLESLVSQPGVEALAQALMIFDFEEADRLISEVIQELTTTTV